MVVYVRPEWVPGGREECGTGARDCTVVCHHSVGGDCSDLGNSNVRDRRQRRGLSMEKGEGEGEHTSRVLMGRPMEMGC